MYIGCLRSGFWIPLLWVGLQAPDTFIFGSQRVLHRFVKSIAGLPSTAEVVGPLPDPCTRL